MSSITCRYHPDKPAEFECADCHKRFCSKCVKEVSGRYYCGVCQKRLEIDVQRDTERKERRDKWRDRVGWIVGTLLFGWWYWIVRRSGEHAAKRKGAGKDVSEEEIQARRLKDGSLLRDLKDRSAGVRLAAADALERAGDATAVEPLIQALKDESRLVRRSVARALGTIGDGRAVGSLIEALKDESSPVRLEAAWALGGIGDQAAVEPLTEALEDEDNDVRKAAEEALNAIRQTS